MEVRKVVIRRNKGVGGEPTEMRAFRLPVSVRAWLRQESKARGDTETEVVVDSLRLERALTERFAPEAARLEAFARGTGLDPADEPTVFCALVALGLDAAEKGRKR